MTLCQYNSELPVSRFRQRTRCVLTYAVILLVVVVLTHYLVVLTAVSLSSSHRVEFVLKNGGIQIRSLINVTPNPRIPTFGSEYHLGPISIDVFVLASRQHRALFDNYSLLTDWSGPDYWERSPSSTLGLALWQQSYPDVGLKIGGVLPVTGIVHFINLPVWSLLLPTLLFVWTSKLVCRKRSAAKSLGG